jgi:hypothetical protein
VWNTYKFDEIFMLVVPLHCFHMLINLLSVDSMSQTVISCSIVLGWDVFQLWFYLLDAEQLHENRYNIVVFCCTYTISVMVFSLVFQNQMKTMFIQQYYLKSINEEFKELLRHFPEGVMITRTAQTKKKEHLMREEPMFAQELASFLYNMKKKFQTEVMFMNASMKEFVQTDDDPVNMLGLIDKKMFRVYNFKKSNNESNATLFSYKASEGNSKGDND